MSSATSIGVLLARLVLAMVFFVAGLAKLLDRPGSKKELEEFHIWPFLAGPLTVLLPVAEISIALALISAASARWGAMAALALLASFGAGISATLAQGRRPNCHCFGQLHSAPLGWGTFTRTVFLAVLALVVFRQPLSPSFRDLLTLANVGVFDFLLAIVLLGIIAAQSWFLLHLLRQHGRMLLRLDALEESLGITPPTGSRGNGSATGDSGLAVGAPAPAFSLPTADDGETVTLESLRDANKPILLIFSHPGCGACVALLPEIGRWQRDYREKMVIAVIDSGRVSGSATHGATRVLLQTTREVAEA